MNIHLIPREKLASTSHLSPGQVEPLGGGFGGLLRVSWVITWAAHWELTRISATETEKWVLARLAAWACVSVHSGAFCSLARQSRQRGGRGAQGNVGQWASQFVLCAPRQQPAHILARAPARGFLHWIHYTLRRKSVFASILILVYSKKVIYMSAFILILQFQNFVWHTRTISFALSSLKSTNRGYSDSAPFTIIFVH